MVSFDRLRPRSRGSLVVPCIKYPSFGREVTTSRWDNPIRNGMTKTKNFKVSSGSDWQDRGPTPTHVPSHPPREPSPSCPVVLITLTDESAVDGECL